MTALEQAQQRYTRLLKTCRSAILATADASGQPAASYAPFIRDKAGRFYLFASGLAAHARNLAANPRASLMLIADEADSEQLFARCRAIWACTVQPLPRQEPRWEAIADRFQQQFGHPVDLLRQLPDFQLWELQPRGGQFISGFGAAYRLDPATPDRVLPNPAPSRS